jgi:cell division transport system permease protein
MPRRIFPKYRYDIALETGVGANLVAWATALMVFFMTLALAVNLGLAGVSQNWVSGLSGSLTVEITPPAVSGDRDTLTDAQQKSFDADVARVIALAQKDKGVGGARALSHDEVAKLIEPWLGDKMPKDLALPALIDVTLEKGADTKALQKAIVEAVPEATIDTHAETLSDVETLVNTARLFVILLTTVIMLLAVIAISGMVRAKLAIHHDEIETLHLIGAHDEYIARQFRHHTLRGTVRGALAGVAAMLVTLGAVSYVTRAVDSSVLPDTALSLGEWAALVVTPVVLGVLIAHITAQKTVIRALARLM